MYLNKSATKKSNYYTITFRQFDMSSVSIYVVDFLNIINIFSCDSKPNIFKNENLLIDTPFVSK